MANIAVKQVVPATQRASNSSVLAIASRSLRKAQAAAQALGIPRAYGSYEALLEDPDVEAVYNPLPNHLHVPLTIRAAEMGKHVLCEKPLALTAHEARTLIAVRDRTGVQIAEAFMVRAHPQWRAVRDVIASGRIGALRMITGHFSYFRRDPNDVRSNVDWGGGALMDVGCYPVTMARWLFGSEPVEVIAQLERDPDLRIDRLGSALMRFPTGQALFSCAGQLVPHQSMHIFGTSGRIGVRIPFNAPSDYSGEIDIDNGRDLRGSGIETLSFPPVNQYMLQAEQFADAVRGRGHVPVTVEDGVANMAVLDALFRSEQSRQWERP